MKPARLSKEELHLFENGLDMLVEIALTPFDELKGDAVVRNTEKYMQNMPCDMAKAYIQCVRALCNAKQKQSILDYLYKKIHDDCDRVHTEE